MSSLFKDIFNPAFFSQFIKHMQALDENFNDKVFIQHIYSNNWEQLEFKQRMRHITQVLHQQLGADFSRDAQLLVALVQALQQEGEVQERLAYIFLPDYIELYGLDDLRTSAWAMENITPFVSCEFAVRPFIIRYGQEMMDMMQLWAKNENEHVRRLATEGCRPRLPWAMALPAFKQDPEPVLPILERLKADPSSYVRRSVANNLNDIAKDHPQLVISIAKRWLGKNPQTDALVKHGCRTLLKAGNTELMALFGFGSVAHIAINNFNVHTPKLKVGQYLCFSFALENTANEEAKIRLEYAVYYQKANGSLSKKVYKISERIYAAHSSTTIERKQSFKIISTRKFHPGLHQVALIVNGKEYSKHNFQLEE